MRPFKAIVMSMTLFGSLTLCGQGIQANTSIDAETSPPRTSFAVDANTPATQQAQRDQPDIPHRRYGSVLSDHDQDPPPKPTIPNKTSQPTTHPTGHPPPVLRYGNHQPRTQADASPIPDQKTTPENK